LETEAPAPASTEAASEREALRRDWQLYAAMTFLFMFGFTLYSGVFQNFFREDLNGTPIGLGALESLREIPGLIAALMAGLLVALAESRVAALGLVITGVGIGLTGATNTFWPLVAVTVFWSIGFHLWSTVQSAIVLALAKGVEGGRHLARMRSVGAVATIVALAAGWLTARLVPEMSYATYFVACGLAIVGAGVLAAFLSPAASWGKRERIVVRREYGLYYLLMFLEGCRRQIFSIFALFTLVLVYETPLQTVLLLSLINAVLSTLTAPVMGRFVDRHGERKPLTIYAIGICLVFVGYATIPHAFWLYGLYIVDNVLFTFSIGFSTYLHRIARPGELTPSFAMGTTMNHVAAVSLPILGAWLWKESGDYRTPFWIGTGLAIVALIATQRIPDHSVEAVG
jgi:MFS family permease